MADPKVTKMVMKVDLQCYKCYRKIKKVLCCCPQIRDQVYDEKQNTVTITVVCCSPEKIMERIACKAGDTVESIEILPDKPKDPEKPKPVEKPKEPEKKEPEKPKPADKPVEPEKKKEPEKPKPAEKPKDPEKPKEPEKKKEPEKPKPVEPLKEAAKPPEQAPPPAPAPKAPAPTPAPAPAPKMQEPALALAPTLLDPVAQGYPQLTPTGQVPMYPTGMCCCCHEGGPCYHGYGQAPMWYNGYTQPAAYNFPDRNQGYYVNRCDYISEENASGCSIM
ncbi:hypothetical protein MLD38_021043 [Melastoma candidum]|uniref:Uncharacterized protein n=1 Tax=Melastoma candidum TaxID=119954 RepID=A0ACB9QEW4_9MYRT|nr:hypothetical protein MLD38_021043 [Melastoma candidum]